MIPRELYANGATWTTIGWQSGVIIGPMLGGFMLAYLGRETSLFSVAVLLGICFILINLLHKRTFPKIETANVLESLEMVSVLSGKLKLFFGQFLLI